MEGSELAAICHRRRQRWRREEALGHDGVVLALVLDGPLKFWAPVETEIR
jgi:hypothetical protein